MGLTGVKCLLIFLVIMASFEVAVVLGDGSVSSNLLVKNTYDYVLEKKKVIIPVTKPPSLHTNIFTGKQLKVFLG